MKAFVTKYALTQGIQEVNGDLKSADMLSVKGMHGFDSYFHRDEWHETRESAVAKAERMRLAKIASPQKATREAGSDDV